jgi:MoxR-like ATPase
MKSVSDALAALPIARLTELHQAIVASTRLPASRSVMIGELMRHPAQVAAALAAHAPAGDDRLDALISRVDSIDHAQNALLSQIATMLGPKGAIERAVQTAQAAADAALANGRAISALESRPAVDAASVQSEIARVVRDMLGPVVAAAKDEGREDEIRSAVAAAPSTPVDTLWAGMMPGATVSTWGSADAPAIDPGFVWPEAALRGMVAAEREGLNIWLAGPKGTGKTTLAQQYAARTGRPFTRINFFRHSSSEDYLGAGALSEGSTTWEPGDFLRAYTTPGALILLDELSTAHPGVLSHLNGLLEPGARVSLGGRVWSRAPGVMIVAADNTNGSGDVTGRYAGTQSANSATVDRFGLMLRVDYLDPATESRALANATGCTPQIADHVIAAFTAIRAKVDTADVVDPPSLRQAIAFVRATRWMSVDDAWQSAIVTRQPPESAAALLAVLAAHINVSLFGV